MGGAISSEDSTFPEFPEVENTEDEFYRQLGKPMDGSDLSSLVDARQEISRIRQKIQLANVIEMRVSGSAEEKVSEDEGEGKRSIVGTIEHSKITIPEEGISTWKEETAINIFKGLGTLGVSFKEFLDKTTSSEGKFTDNEFPPSSESLAHDWNTLEKRDEWQQLEWVRILDVTKSVGLDADVFQGGISPKDILQGNVGNCYFLSALAVLAEYPNRIKKLFNESSQKVSEKGLYAVKMNINGRWEDIVIDDHIPCNNGRPAFSQPSEGCELWVLLLEKAWAKVNGSYQTISSGDPGQILRNLTGAPSERIQLDDPVSLWRQLLEAQEKNYVATASINSKTFDLSQYGLVENHAYAILQVEDVGKAKLIRLRNPWGRFEWKGDWSDNDPAWTAELKAKVDFEKKDDGIFFMSLEQFVQLFSVVHINRVRDDWVQSSMKTTGTFVTPETATPEWGQLDPSKKAILKLTCPNNNTVVNLGIHQKDKRHIDSPGMGEPYVAVKHWTVSAKEPHKTIGSSVFLSGRDVVCENMKLSKGDYYVYVLASGLSVDSEYNKFVASTYGNSHCEISVLHDKMFNKKDWEVQNKSQLEILMYRTRVEGKITDFSKYDAPNISMKYWSDQTERVACLLYENKTTTTLFGSSKTLKGLEESVSVTLQNMRLACFFANDSEQQADAERVGEHDFKVTVKPGQQLLVVFEVLDTRNAYSFSYRRSFRILLLFFTIPQCHLKHQNNPTSNIANEILGPNRSIQTVSSGDIPISEIWALFRKSQREMMQYPDEFSMIRPSPPRNIELHSTLGFYNQQTVVWNRSYLQKYNQSSL